MHQLFNKSWVLRFHLLWRWSNFPG